MRLLPTGRGAARACDRRHLERADQENYATDETEGTGMPDDEAFARSGLRYISGDRPAGVAGETLRQAGERHRAPGDNRCGSRVGPMTA